MWNKIGLLLSEGVKTQTPVPYLMDDETCRVFYAKRNYSNKSQIFYFDLNLKTLKIKYISKNSLLLNGNPGAFDYSGVMPSSIIEYNSVIYLYYTGWSQREDVPYHNSIGLAISYDQGVTFNKYSDGPIITSSINDPYFVGTPFVMRKDDQWICWYYSSVGWFSLDSKLEPKYLIKYATSNDGINWNTNKEICINFKNKAEGGICCPSVIEEDGIYKMWFSKRAIFNYRELKDSSYRIGYAESGDGILWQRKDQESGINISKDGWDSQMICYSSILKYNDKKYMFYCGNNFGESGIGLAIS